MIARQDAYIEKTDVWAPVLSGAKDKGRAWNARPFLCKRYFSTVPEVVSPYL